MSANPATPFTIDSLANLVWLRARRAALMQRMHRAGAAPLTRPLDNGLRKTQIDALAMLDRRIAELEAGLV